MVKTERTVPLATAAGYRFTGIVYIAATQAASACGPSLYVAASGARLQIALNHPPR